MNILHVYKDFEPGKGGGGVARHIEGLCAHLADGNQVSVAAFVFESRSDGIQTLPLSYGRLLQYVRSSDVVHVHGARTLCALVTAAVAVVLRKPFFYTPHCYYEDKISLKQLAKRIWDFSAERFLLRTANGTFLLASSWAEYVSRRIARPRNTFIVPNCIDESSVLIRSRKQNESSLPGAPSILCVGRLDPVKCVDHVIQAMARSALSSAVLHVVGKGTDRERLEAVAHTHGVASRVNFYGFKDDDAVAELAAQADVFVLPSAQEGLPTVLLEMILRRLPVVASDIPGNMAVMQPLSLEACTYPFGEIEVLAEKIATVATSVTIGDSIIQNLRAAFTWDAQARNIENQYRAAVQ